MNEAGANPSQYAYEYGCAKLKAYSGKAEEGGSQPKCGSVKRMDIGSHMNGGTKTYSLSESDRGIVCPTKVTQLNWLSDDDYADTFNVKMEFPHVYVSRDQRSTAN